MQIEFHKYHGTGNDFVLIDNRKGILSGNENDWFAQICHRHFGIGADGVILLNDEQGFDFGMDYFNSDGQRSTMCGNGGRCMVRFAADLGIVSFKAKFLAIDGPHDAEILHDRIRLKMIVPNDFRKINEADYYIFTGSPHYVRFLSEGIGNYPVVAEGRKIREAWPNGGTNVNFVQQIDAETYHVRTYERGVEDETLSCGTGVTAVAEVVARLGGKDGVIKIEAPGGRLQVTVNQGHEPWLEGPATFVFTGKIKKPN